MLHRCIKTWTPCAAALLLAALAPSARAADWPQWGGSNNRSMVSLETGLPDTFTPPKRDPKTNGLDIASATNVRWAVNVGTNCYGSPVVSQGRVLVGSNLIPGDPRYTNNRATCACYDEKTGKVLWMFSVAHPDTPNLAHGSSLGVCASPTVDGDRVYVNSWTDILCLALDGQNDKRPAMTDQAQYSAGKGGKVQTIEPVDGKLLWRCEIPKVFGVDMHDALAPAPLVIGDMLVFSTGNGVTQDHKTHATPDLPCLVAVDKITGKPLAGDDENIGRTTFHGQWSSPMVATVAGKQQLVWGGGNGICYAFDPTPVPSTNKYGATFKKIWSYDLNRGNAKSYHSPGGPSEIIATPVCVNDKIYVSVGQDWTHSVGKGHVACIDAIQTGTIAEPLWDYTDASYCVGTVAVADGLAYVADLKGSVHCIDAATGKAVWVFTGAAPFHASPLIADGKIFVADSRGKFYIFAHGRTEKLLSTIDLHGEAGGAAIAANNTLFVGSARMLQAIAK